MPLFAGQRSKTDKHAARAHAHCSLCSNRRAAKTARRKRDNKSPSLFNRLTSFAASPVAGVCGRNSRPTPSATTSDCSQREPAADPSADCDRQLLTTSAGRGLISSSTRMLESMLRAATSRDRRLHSILFTPFCGRSRLVSSSRSPKEKDCHSGTFPRIHPLALTS
jgi:hypothetical protein